MTNPNIAQIAAHKLSQPVDDKMAINKHHDPTTLSNYHNFRTTHTVANIRLDFERKRVIGDVVLTLESVTNAEAGEVVLDTSFLDIEDVSINGEKQQWQLSPRMEPYGSALNIKLANRYAMGKTLELKVKYSTTDKCTALQWMDPAQTGTDHPLMFSQCQAIHARSLFPCQDTPAVKSTYDFNVSSPHQVLASGLSTDGKATPTSKGDGGNLYQFQQKVPMASYLFALASGDLVCAEIGPRSTVWSTPALIKASQWEFETTTEPYIQAAEKLVFPYAWGTYNVLVLPPSFPYGGMENPIYTFVTPTLVSGDRQNTDVIAHELAHSWSGNLVSPVSWEHFWLNEGWTTYLERRLAGIKYGAAHRDFSGIIGWKALQDSVERFGEDNQFTQLIVNLHGQDPDDAFSSVPYDKGGAFLIHLENTVGIEKWDTFIPHYFNKYKGKSLDSYDFKSTLLDFFASDAEATKALEGVAWDDWFYKRGLPPKPNFDTSLADKCYSLAEKWIALSNGKSDFTPQPSDIEGWFGQQLYVFLETLEQADPPLKPEVAEKLGSIYGITKSHNVELTARYYTIALQARAKSQYPAAADFLGTVGRMKFCRPVYKHLLAADRELAIQTFQKHKNFYHPICRQMIEKMIADSK